MLAARTQDGVFINKNKNLEQIIEALPELIPFTNKKDGIVYYSGLCIKYSTGNSCWVAGYGGGINPGKKRAFCEVYYWMGGFCII